MNRNNPETIIKHLGGINNHNKEMDLVKQNNQIKIDKYFNFFEQKVIDKVKNLTEAQCKALIYHAKVIYKTLELENNRKLQIELAKINADKEIQLAKINKLSQQQISQELPMNK